MANIVTLNTPTKADYISHFVDRFLADRAAGQQSDAADALQKSQDAFKQKQFDQTGAYQQGQLANQQATFKAGQEDKEIESFVKTAIEPYMSSGRPEDMAKAQQNVQQVLAAHPDWKGRLIGYALRAGGGQLPQDQTNANVGQFSANQTGIAAGGGTDPNAVNFATHKAIGSFMPKEGFEQQQAMDLATRQPAKPSGPTALTNAVPRPTGAPVSDFEARSVGALPTSAQNQTAQTSITTTGMQQAGETKRTAMKIAADKEKNTFPMGAGASGGDLSKAPAIIQMLVNRTYDPMLMRRFKPEQQEVILNAARQFDQNLNMQDYPEQFKIKSRFASGKDKDNVKALNTAIGHLHDMWEASNKIDNFESIPLLNTTVNALKNRAAVASGGGKPLIDFNAAVTGASGELASLYKGGVGTVDEVKQWRDVANPNGSGEQRTGAIQQLGHMVGSRFNALKSLYEKTGRSFDDDQINAVSKKALRDMGVDPQTFEITGKGSQTAAPPPITTHDGLKWKKNPDGSYTQVP